MTAFVIVFGDTPKDRLEAYQFENAQEARERSSRFVDLHVFMIEKEEDVKFSGPQLVQVFNGLTDSGIKKFENREIGAKRLFSVLPQVSIRVSPMKVAGTMSDAAVQTTETTKKRGRKAVGEAHPSRSNWKKMRGGTMRARIAQAMFGNQFRSASDIARMAGVPEDRVLPHIYATHKDCGIGYFVDNETYKLDLPHEVKKFEDLLQIETPAEAKKKAGAKAKSETEEDAEEETEEDAEE